MEHKIDHGCYDDDVLSLRDLQVCDQTATSSTRSSPRTPSGRESFEFFPTLSNIPNATGDIMFFGRIVGSSSCRMPDRPTDHVIPLRSVSNRDLGSPRHGVNLSTSGKKVNMTTVSSKSSKLKMFIFGPVKYPEMEMRSIRERQGRRAPSRMFPVVVDGGNGRKVVAGTNKSTVTCRARWNSVFEKSLACLRA